MTKPEVLISDLSQHLGISDLKLSVNETCQTVINDRFSLNIEVSNTYDSIFLYWQLDLKDTEISKQFLLNLLSFSYMGLATNGAFFSINQSDGIVFCRRVYIDTLTSARFITIFDEFVDAIICCDKEVSSFSETVDTASLSSHNAKSDAFSLMV